MNKKYSKTTVFSQQPTSLMQFRFNFYLTPVKNVHYGIFRGSGTFHNLFLNPEYRILFQNSLKFMYKN